MCILFYSANQGVEDDQGDYGINVITSGEVTETFVAGWLLLSDIVRLPPGQCDLPVAVD